MDKYSILLVDDEEEVLDVIKAKIDWEGLGFTVMGSASNGVKALELAEINQPDVVITDIRMPYMDGLELSRRLRSEFPSVRIMIFTGYDEFEYAKEAVHLEIGEYLLKPVNATELTEALSRLKASLDQEREEKLNVKNLEDYYMQSLPLLQMNFFMSLIEGRVREEDLNKYLNDYKIDFKGPVYVVGVIHTSEHHVPAGMSPLLFSMSVQQSAMERLDKAWNGKFFTYLGNTVVICEMKSPEDMTKLTDESDRFCKWADRIIGAKVTIGIGRTCSSLLEIAGSYDGAREAVSYRVLYGSGRAISISEIAPGEEKYDGAGDDAALHDIFKAVHMGTDISIREAVEKYVLRIHENAVSVNQYDLIIKEMVNAWYRFCVSNFLNFDEFTDYVKNPYKEVPLMDAGILKNWLGDAAISIARKLSATRNSSSRQIINRAEEIVKQDYANPDLTLDSVCSDLGVSVSYFSSLFKKESGKSFITYLTDYRMEQAARLLIETNEKNYEIAEHVGYVDANYFSYVFKKTYGMPPSKYKTEHTS